MTDINVQEGDIPAKGKTPDQAEPSKVKQVRKPGGGNRADDGLKSLTRKQVKLDEKTIEILTRVGGGVLSLGIREARRRIVEAKDTRKFSVERHLKREKDDR